MAKYRYIIAKKSREWTNNQQKRADILFEQYPLIKKSMQASHLKRYLHQQKQSKSQTRFIAMVRKDQRTEGIKEFNTVANTIQDKMEAILNYFVYRNTNANANHRVASSFLK